MQLPRERNKQSLGDDEEDAEEPCASGFFLGGRPFLFDRSSFCGSFHGDRARSREHMDLSPAVVPTPRSLGNTGII